MHTAQTGMARWPEVIDIKNVQEAFKKKGVVIDSLVRC
jgi:hypothetical protein